jgi:hypothetical protein
VKTHRQINATRNMAKRAITVSRPVAVGTEAVSLGVASRFETGS